MDFDRYRTKPIQVLAAKWETMAAVGAEIFGLIHYGPSDDQGETFARRVRGLAGC